ncbi:hypothetical protein [Burkholderia ubonensis]|nr:hypothetical protein [Burkholderia ubonensis]
MPNQNLLADDWIETTIASLFGCTKVHAKEKLTQECATLRAALLSPIEQPSTQNGPVHAYELPSPEPFAIAYQVAYQPGNRYFIHRWAARLQWRLQHERDDVRNITALYAGALPDMSGYLDMAGQ